MLDRRQFIAGSTSLTLASTARAHLPGGMIPVQAVDRLTIQVLVDNATFGPFLPDQVLPGLEVRRRTGDGGPRLKREALIAEFGLSLLALSEIGQSKRQVLVDFGYTAHAIANNLGLLGVDFDSIDAAVLSHGHLDHYGGFAGLFEGRPDNRRLPLFVGGEETFCERVALIGSPPPLMGALDRNALARAGFDVRIAPDPMIVAEHAFTTGLIPLTSFERAAIPTVMRPGKGCTANRLSRAKAQLEELPDDGEHELGTCYVVKRLGLVVISSCSHRGVLNAVRRAQMVSGIKKVHAVIGGFHLVRPRTEAEALRTAAGLKALNPAFVVPMHCTGEAFIAEAARLMPGKVVRPYVGTQLVFQAS